MSKKIYGPRQSQAKTGLYDLKAGGYTKTPLRGRPVKNPIMILDTLRQAKVRINENTDEYELLQRFGEDVQDGSYGRASKDTYDQILNKMGNSKNPYNEYGDLLRLLKVVKEENTKQDPDYDLAVENSVEDFGYTPNIIFGKSKEYLDKYTNPKISGIQQKKTDQIKAPYYDMAKDTTLKETQTPDVSFAKIKPAMPTKAPPPRPVSAKPAMPTRKPPLNPKDEAYYLRNFPTPMEQGIMMNTQNPVVQTSTKYNAPPPNKKPPNTPYIQNLLDNFPTPQEIGVMRETIKPVVEFASRAYMDGIKPTRDYINPIVDSQKSKGYINPIVDSQKSRGYINPIVDKAKKHVFGVGSSSSSTPSPLIPDDLQNLEAYQYESHYGVPIKKTYGVDDEQKRMFETREERDARRQLESYKDEIQLLGNRPNSSFRGADIYDKDDMSILKEEGNAAGGAELGKPYKPDIFNNMNPVAPVGQTAKGRIGLPTQSNSQNIYPTISGVPLPNYNKTHDVRIKKEGISGNDNVAQDRRVQIMDNIGSEGLGMRVTRTFADLAAQQNALTNVGGGIMSQIANSLRQSADSGEEKKNGDDGLYGAEGSMFNNQDVSNPRTLDQRFSRLGQQRMTKDFKINKYTNLKKLNKQKYDTVSAPSLKEIRARTLGYVQPNSKVAGNSVELIRQSNATQMKLNNMFMP
jgi:hypothetical protein